MKNSPRTWDFVIPIGGALPIVFLLLILSLFIQGSLASREFLKEARAARREGNFSQAIQSYARATAWRMPFASAPKIAASELLEMRHDKGVTPKERIEIVRRLKGALLASRSFLAQEKGKQVSEELRETRAILDELSAKSQVSSKIILEKVYQPSYFAQICASVTFLVWIVCVGFCILFGFRPDGTIVWRPFVCFSLATGISFVFWLLYLTNA